MKAKIWLAGWLTMTAAALCAIGMWVYKVDPFMHYHKPAAEEYYYTLDNQRSQNDGIIKHFDYDALITGTSMTENFKTSEMDEIFGTNAIKVAYSGGSYKEINDNIEVAIRYNPDLKIVVRALDMGYFFDRKDQMRTELGEYPAYLYDSNPFNDVQYLFNRDIIWDRVYKMETDKDMENFKPGILSFDEYSNWQNEYTFGIHTVCPEGVEKVTKGEPVHLTDEEREFIRENIEQNVTALAEENPEVTFYYFFPPYSVIWWKNLVSTGEIYRQVEAEQFIIELILECSNIKLYSFNNQLDITADLNNYKDDIHYGEWINSLILCWMHDEKCRLTKENYEDYLHEELSNYTDFDYESLNGQEDHTDEYQDVKL